MTVCIISHHTPSYKPLADIIIPNLEKYCTKHGYDWRIRMKDDEQFHFIKTEEIRQALEYYDLVFAIELDAMIMNHTIKVESFLDEENEMYYTADRNGANFGVCLVKSTTWTKELFDWINSKKDKYGDEQNVLENYPNIQKVKRLTVHPNFNSIPYEYYRPSLGVIGYKDGDEVTMPTHEQGNFEKGDFVMHLPGFSLERRIEIFQNHLKDIIYE